MTSSAAPRERTVRVFLWDDVEEVRAVTREALEDDERLTVVGDAGVPHLALEHIRARRPDVVLLDLAMPEMDGLEAIPCIAEVSPEARVVVFSGFEAKRMKGPALSRGARAYIEKGTPMERVRAAVLHVAEGPPGLAQAGGSADSDEAGGPPVSRRTAGSSGSAQGPTAPLAPRPPAPARSVRRGAALFALPARLDRPSATLTLAAILFAAVFVARLLVHEADEAVLLLCVVPVALLAIRFGLRGGLAGAGVGCALLTAWVMTRDPVVSAGGITTRVVTFVVLGVLLGLAVDRAGRIYAAQEASRVELERSNEELEQFAYVASHDLSEPLRSIAGFAQLLEKRYRGRLDERADLYIDHITGSVGRLQNLIEDLLAYSGVGRRELEPKPVDCAALVARVLELLAARIDEQGAKVEVSPLPTVSADERMLAQVFQNLISNALKFTDDRSAEVSVWAEREAGTWRFSVADNGIGIPAEKSERVFQVFQRLHRREEYEGTGIGLPICRRAVERHGGSIWVESRPAGGCVFRFTVAEPPDPT